MVTFTLPPVAAVTFSPQACMNRALFEVSGSCIESENSNEPRLAAGAEVLVAALVVVDPAGAAVVAVLAGAAVVAVVSVAGPLPQAETASTTTRQRDSRITRCSDFLLTRNPSIVWVSPPEAE